ncbi:MAG TPA: PIG-L family deacetylase, partial [Bacillota bacterium]|nr:PIG-L family deacetylase [Bacillota bacterium]
DYPSAAVKDPENAAVTAELKELIDVARPQVIYTHNLADKHDTHIGVAINVLKAIRQLPVECRPEKVYGCEVWRNLDWVNDTEKVVFNVSAHPNLAAALLEVFDSQICGGKRYDLATQGRRLANATYAASHSTDTATALIYAMDLTPLIIDEQMDIIQYVQDYINRFRQDVTDRLQHML